MGGQLDEVASRENVNNMKILHYKIREITR